MSEIRVKDNESLDNALKRFKRSCAKSGVLAEVRKREHYEKPSVRRKKKAEAAKPSSGGGAKQSLISVNLNKLDTLVDLVGEIVITEAMVAVAQPHRQIRITWVATPPDSVCWRGSCTRT